MNSRQRVLAALERREHDRVPVDFGAMVLSGAHVSIVAKLREKLGLGRGPVKVIEPGQMLGEVGEDLAAILQTDVIALRKPTNVLGFAQENWKPWRTFDGTDVLVPGLFNTDPAEDGSIYQWACGDRNYPPSMRMPKGGFYLDCIIRQKPIDENKLNFMDNCEEFKVVSDEALSWWQRSAKELYARTDKAIVTAFGGTGFGDAFLVPGPFLKDPKGIRDLEEWYISTAIRRDYILNVFNYQADIAIKNLELMYQAIGENVHLVFICGTDLATQESLFCSPDTYRELYKPFHKRINDWIHKNTKWKTLKHSCGACEPLIGDLIEAGFDALNPVQCSAAGMDPEKLVAKYGKNITFWGGGVDTQKTLPFGKPEEVYEQVKERVNILGKENGLVFAAIHNIQCSTPIENVLAMFEALKDIRGL
ncbi:MAG: uroporphyrinogen decarboxylase family protein [Sedimentisphaerales bacterium]|nr:uroporphyrinogen decarboxylase family protein [Sedimentisphaerales bacterium]